jgi:hypothetical protein
MTFGSGSSHIFVYHSDHASDATLEAYYLPYGLLFFFNFDADAGFLAYETQLGDPSTRQGYLRLGARRLPYIAPYTRCPFSHNDVYACMRWGGWALRSRAFWGRVRCTQRGRKYRDGVRRGCVYGMLGANAPLRVVLYVPRGRGMVALLRPKGLRACPVVYFRKALVASGGACLSSCLYELYGLYTATLLSLQPRTCDPSTSPTEAVRVPTLSFAICVPT